MTNTTRSKETLGARIRLARIEAGLSQQALANKVGAYQPDVSAWESDRRSLSLQTLAALADVLGKTADWLLTGRQGAA